MLTYQAPAFRPIGLGQAPTVAVPPSPTPAFVSPVDRKSPATLLSAGAVGGALGGLLLSFILPQVSRLQMDAAKRTVAVVTGALGGVTGVGAALLLKD